MTKRFFITGTDTDVGKTYVTVKLLEAYNSQGLKTLGLKPLASGCELLNHQLINHDALLLQKNSSVKTSYELINPIRYPEPIAPHIASALQHETLSVARLMESLKPAFMLPVDICLIEGAGGWFVPLNEQETMANFVKALNIPVILVVGLRLGCLNHALLTAHAITQANIALQGFIANCVDPDFSFIEENIDALKRHLSVPCLQTFTYSNKHTL